MKVKVSELSGLKLDLMVAKAEGIKPSEYHEFNNEPYMPSTDWAQAGPIIEKWYIDIKRDPKSLSGWLAVRRISDSPLVVKGPTPLIAAMRCYVTSKLGYEVEVN